jgi:chromosome segregation ATPase
VNLVTEFFKEFSSWIAAGATGLCLWFIIRFIDKNDKFEEKQETFKTTVKKDIDDVSKSFKDSLEIVERLAKSIKDDSASIKLTNLDFQSKIANELLNIKREMLVINSSMDTTTAKANHISEQFSKTAANVEQLHIHLGKLQEILSAHHKSLSAGAQAFQHTRQEIDHIKSTVTRLNDNMILIHSEKEKKKQ